MLSQEYIRSLLDYDQLTGVFRWKHSVARCVKSGDVAGCCKKPDGYHYIKIRSKAHRGHNLAWLYVYGKFPVELLDHINGDPSDNRIANLREASKQQNCWNGKIRSTNTSGYKNVCFDGGSNKGLSYIFINKKQVKLGRFQSAEEAYGAFVNAAKKHYGEFARMA